jgi:hypothetical protein
MCAVVVAAGAGPGLAAGWRAVAGVWVSSAVGVKRQLRGKPAGLRTQSIVGTGPSVTDAGALPSAPLPVLTGRAAPADEDWR